MFFPVWNPQLGCDSLGSQSTESCCSSQTQQLPLSVPRGRILTQSTLFVMDTVTDRNKVSYIISPPAIQALQQSLTKFWQTSIQESSTVWAAVSTNIAKVQLEMFRHITCLEIFKYSFARITVAQSPRLQTSTPQKGCAREHKWKTSTNKWADANWFSNPPAWVCVTQWNLVSSLIKFHYFYIRGHWRQTFSSEFKVSHFQRVPLIQAWQYNNQYGKRHKRN